VPVFTAETNLGGLWCVVEDAGGQSCLGAVKPISNAAVANDGKKTPTMLRRRVAETVPDLLARLDAAMAAAQSSGSEWINNRPNPDARNEI